MEDQIVQALQKIQNVAPHLWAEMVKNFYWNSVAAFSALLFLSGASAWFSFFFYMNAKAIEGDSWQNENSREATYGVAAVLAVLSVLWIVVAASSQIGDIASPEGGLLQKLLKSKH